MTRGRDRNIAHLVADDLDDARQQWIDVFSRDCADLGPAHAAERAATDINTYGPQPRRSLTRLLSQGEQPRRRHPGQTYPLRTNAYPSRTASPSNPGIGL